MKVTLPIGEPGLESLSAGAPNTQSALFVLCVMARTLQDVDYKLAKDPIFAEFKKRLPQATLFLKNYGLGEAFADAYAEFRAEKFTFDGADSEVFAKAMASSMAMIRADSRVVSLDEFKMLDKLRLYFNKDSLPAWRHICNAIGIVESPSLAKLYVPALEELNGDATDAGGPVPDVDRLKAITKKLTGRSNDDFIHGFELTVAQKKKNAKLVVEYGILSKALTARYKKALKAYVLSKGGKPQPIDVVSKVLAAKGADRTAKGFKGFVDADNMYYTPEGKKLDKSLFGLVKPNPAYNPKTDSTFPVSTVAVSGVNGRAVEYRSVADTKVRAAKRRAAVGAAASDIAKLRPRWAADLKATGTKNQVIAAMVESAYTTLARVGSKGNKTTDGATTYGLSTLMMEHVKIDAKGVHFDYAGKKGTEQPATLFATGPQSDATTRAAIAVIKQLAAGKGKKDLLFLWEGNRIVSSKAKAYMRSIGFPEGFGIHNFRHLAGNKMFAEAIKSCPFVKGDPKTTQAAVEKWYDQALMPIGQALHHRTGAKVTSRTAQGSYIDLQSQKDFFLDLGLHVPKNLMNNRANK